MWTLHFIGKPEAIVRALSVFANSLTGTDRTRFLVALPALETLVNLNNGVPISVNATGADDGAVSVVLMRSNAMHVE